MFKAILVSLGLIVGSSAFAAPTLGEVVFFQQHQVMLDQVHAQGLDFKVGETNNYSLDMGFIKGTMIMKCREINADGIWLDQDMDLGFAGKQKISTLLDPNTGAVKKMIVNGKEQAPEKQNIEVVEVKEDHITVPAGAFDCIHATLKNKDDGKITNAWINPQQIPLSGMLKTIAPSQFGDVTVVLTSFKKL